MQIKINKAANKLERLFESQYLLQRGKASAYIVGDLLGQLNNQGFILSEGVDTKKKLMNQIINLEDLEKLDIINYIGNFTIILLLEDINILQVLTSFAGYSPYVTRVESFNKLQIDFDENLFLKKNKEKINPSILSMISCSHQLVVRFPTSFFGINSIYRNPAGHVSSFDLNTQNVKLKPLIKGCAKDIDHAILGRTLSNILKIYCNFYKNDIGLLFSGGLDSSCLAAALCSQNLLLPFYHIDYKGDFSARSRVACYISTLLGSPSQHLPKYRTPLFTEEIMRNLSLSFMSVPNQMYIGMPVDKDLYSMPKYLITGQGADSIYVIDSFAPSTEMIGEKRIQYIINTVQNRLNINEKRALSNLSIDSLDVNFFAGLQHNKLFLDLINKQCSSLDEHVNYTASDEQIKHPFAEMRKVLIADEIIKLIPELHTSNSILEAFRYIKWMRSLVNVQQNYMNMAQVQNIFRLTPFLEGPMVNLFFSYNIREIESIYIKDHLERLFSCLTNGYSHRLLVEDALKIVREKSDFGIKLGSCASNDEVVQFSKNLTNVLLSQLKSSTFGKSLEPKIQSLTQLLRIAPFL